MPTVKILPPNPLPLKGLTQQKFDQWMSELKLYLGSDDDMERFMTEGIYNQWEAAKNNLHRIANVHDDDPAIQTNIARPAEGPDTQAHADY